MWGDHFLASLSIPHHISTPVRTGLAFLFLHLPRNDTISRILWMRNRRHIFLYRRVCCKCSFCQHRSGFCNYSTDRLKSWIWVNSMFYIFSFIRKIKEKITLFITPILKSLMVPVIWLALTDVIYSRIAPFFALNQIFFSSQWGSNVKSKTPIKFKDQNATQLTGKWKTKSGKLWQILQLLFPKLLLFSLKKWVTLISDRLSTASIKYLNWPSPVFGQFQNGCNKVVIEPHVVQFWFEIILVKKKIELALCAHSILKSRIRFQPKLPSTQFNYHYKLQSFKRISCPEKIRNSTRIILR